MAKAKKKKVEFWTPPAFGLEESLDWMLGEMTNDEYRYLRETVAERGGTVVDINGRLISTLGQAWRTWAWYGSDSTKVAGSMIQISAYIDPRELLDALRHELAHVAAKDRGHGKVWKAAARRLGAKPQVAGIFPNLGRNLYQLGGGVSGETPKAVTLTGEALLLRAKGNSLAILAAESGAAKRGRGGAACCV